MTVRAMKASAVEFLTKPLRDDVLLVAISHAVQRSDAELRRDVESKLLRDRYASLTRREREALPLVVAGRLNKQAAAELDISEITVKAHRGKVMRKMKVRSLPDLVKAAAKLGIAARRHDGHSCAVAMTMKLLALLWLTNPTDAASVQR